MLELSRITRKMQVREIATGRIGRVETIYGKGNRRQPTATTTRVMVRFGTYGNIQSFSPEQLEEA